MDENKILDIMLSMQKSLEGIQAEQKKTNDRLDSMDATIQAMSEKMDRRFDDIAQNVGQIFTEFDNANGELKASIEVAKIYLGSKIDHIESMTAQNTYNVEQLKRKAN